MKKVIATTMAAFLVAQVASAISATVDIASIFRGATLMTVRSSTWWKAKLLATQLAFGRTSTLRCSADDQVSEIDLYISKDLGSVAGWDICRLRIHIPWRSRRRV